MRTFFPAYLLVLSVYGQSDGDVRLVDGNRKYTLGTPIHDGRVEVYYNGEFGTICDNAFGMADAQVLCRQLGYYSVDAYDVSSASTATGQIWLDEMACTGTESRIDECPHNGWGAPGCSHSEDVYIQCSGLFTPSPTRSPLDDGESHPPTPLPSDSPTSMPSSSPTLSPFGDAPTSPNEGDLRLFGGPYESGGPIYEGRVEIFHNGDWGTICDDSASASTDGQVMCRQLGYYHVLAFDYSASSIPDATGQIWLDNLACSGTESRVDECAHNGWGIHNCAHYEDVHIRCGSLFTPSPTRSPLDDGQTHPPTPLPTKTPTSVPSESPTDRPTSLPTRSPLDDGETHPPSRAPTSPNEADLRLFGGPYESGGPIYEGRVEIFHNGEFGTICDDSASASTDGQVMCRQLGYYHVLAFDYPASSIPDATGQIWLDNLGCSGSESRVDECIHNGWGIHNCGHGEDVHIRCGSLITPSPTRSPLDPGETHPPTPSPTKAPTSAPTASPTKVPTSSPTRSPLDDGETHPPTLAPNFIFNGGPTPRCDFVLFSDGSWIDVNDTHVTCVLDRVEPRDGGNDLQYWAGYGCSADGLYKDIYQQNDECLGNATYTDTGDLNITDTRHGSITSLCCATVGTEIVPVDYEYVYEPDPREPGLEAPFVPEPERPDEDGGDPFVPELPPTPRPSVATKTPTVRPTASPTDTPSSEPTVEPTTWSPTRVGETRPPTYSPTTRSPTPSPTVDPSASPTTPPNSEIIGDANPDDDPSTNRNSGDANDYAKSAIQQIRAQVLPSMPVTAISLLITLVLFASVIRNFLCRNKHSKNPQIQRSTKIPVILTFTANIAAMACLLTMSTMMVSAEQWDVETYQKVLFPYAIVSVGYVVGKASLETFFILRVYNSFKGSTFALAKSTVCVLSVFLTLIASVWLFLLVIDQKQWEGIDRDYDYLILSSLDAVFITVLLTLFARKLNGLVMMQKSELSELSELSTNTSQSPSPQFSASNAKLSVRDRFHSDLDTEQEMSDTTTMNRVATMSRAAQVDVVKNNLSTRQTKLIFVITRCIILNIMAFATTVLFGFFSFYYVRHQTHLYILYSAWSIDMLINSVCLYLNFAFASRLYEGCCMCCHRRCQRVMEYYAAKQIVIEHVRSIELESHDLSMNSSQGATTLN